MKKTNCRDGVVPRPWDYVGQEGTQRSQKGSTTRFQPDY